MDAHDAEEKHEIIIIKRHHDGDHDAPHGGAWKVAFADFMTAMMAFFLVLWIVNSTTKETRSSLSRYFNPVQLSDTTPARKGLKEPKDDEFDQQDDKKLTQSKAPTESEKDSHNKSDSQADSSEKDPNKKGEEKTPSTKNDSGAVKSEKPETKKESSSAVEKKEETVKEKMEIKKYSSESQDTHKDDIKKEAGLNKSDEKSVSEKLIVTASNSAMKNTPEGEAFSDPFDRRNLRKQGESENKKTANATEQEIKNASDLKNQEAKKSQDEKNTQSSELALNNVATSIQSEISSLLGKEDSARLGGSLEVKAESEGILISLIDRSDYGMFAVGSADPDTLLLHALDAIGRTLQSVKGTIIIRGHTDGRRFRGGPYDNWQLSSARAQSTFHVLLKKGLDEKKVERIEGYADRKLRRPESPDSPENRRIEILIRKSGA